MHRLLISLCIGIVAAAIDSGPMIARKLDPSFTLSAILTWIALGVIIPAARLLPIAWMNGIVVALLVVAPIIVLVAKLDARAIPVMLAMTVALGAGVGLASGYLVK